jgi:SAM-dependent methyltransferase
MGDGILQDQIEYYRARAGEYDEWWNREGRYDQGDDFAATWRGEVAQVAEWLRSLGPLGQVLELAAGTGNWTVELVPRADHVTAVDASPEVLSINRAKVGANAPVSYVLADVFTWEPPQQYDTIFFSFWITHVPDEHIPAFWSVVEHAAAPGARVVMLDNLGRDSTEPENHIVETPGGRTDLDQGLSERVLNDGRIFSIVKVYRDPERLDELLRPLGWRVHGRNTDRFFTWAQAERI